MAASTSIAQREGSVEIAQAGQAVAVEAITFPLLYEGDMTTLEHPDRHW